MTITIETTPELDRAVLHTIAYNNIHGANVGMTPQQYVEAELQSKLNAMEEAAKEIRKKYYQEMDQLLTDEKMAQAVEYIWGLANS